MKKGAPSKEFSRRDFFRFLTGSAALPLFAYFKPPRRVSLADSQNPLFWVKNIPDQPFYGAGGGHYHLGLDSLLHLMGGQGLKFYRSASVTALSGPQGIIAPEDVVLIKVNAQWKYRGCTNSDLVRGLVKRILDHPDVFTGEVVIVENGQGRGSLNCDTSGAYDDHSVHANANDESHSFLHLVNVIFKDPRVSTYLLDPIRSHFIGPGDHATDGYRMFENVSYPCFTTEGGRRVELREGIWRDGRHTKNLKLINVPVLKHHDTGGSEITVSLKHFYGMLSMNDGNSGFRHYSGLGETCGKMIVSVAAPVLNIVDAIWVSHGSLTGYPAETTRRVNQIAASQDPVALDYFAAKYIMYPIDNNQRHHPDFAGIDRWLTQARDTINERGGLLDPEKGIRIKLVTKSEADMKVFDTNARSDWPEAVISLSPAELEFLMIMLARGVPVRIQKKSFKIANAGTGAFSWRIETDAAWITCSPSSGQGSADVVVRVVPPSLEPGVYSGAIRVFSADALNSPQSIAVHLETKSTLANPSSPSRPRSGDVRKPE